MPRKSVLNAIGLRLKDYDYRYAAWKIPGAIIRGLYAQGATFEECEAYFLQHYPERRPRRHKMHGIEVAKKMWETAQRQFALKALRQPWTEEAQEYLLGFIPEGMREGMRRREPVLTQAEVNAAGAGIAVDTGKSQMELYEQKFGKLVDNKVYRKDEHGWLVETKLDTGDNVEAPWANVFTKFDT